MVSSTCDGLVFASVPLGNWKTTSALKNVVGLTLLQESQSMIPMTTWSFGKLTAILAGYTFVFAWKNWVVGAGLPNFPNPKPMAFDARGLGE